MSQLLLEAGSVDDNDPDSEALRVLREENAALRLEIQTLRLDLDRTKAANAQAVRALRQQLTPMYRALQSLFGEMDAIDPEAVTSQSQPTDSRLDAVWAAWKQRLGGTCGKIIDALRTHKELNTQQLAIATGLHRTTIPKAIYELNRAGLISKNGGRFSLKQL